MNSPRLRVFSLVAAGLVAFVAMPDKAQAYIDPNSTGALYQMLFPVLIALTVAWRWIKETIASIWQRIRRSWVD